MTKLGGVLEACLYAEDLAAAEQFYVGVLGLDIYAREEGRHVFFRASDANVFLVFDPRRTSDAGSQVDTGAGRIPMHGASGAGHVAFSVREDTLDTWRTRLEAAGVEIEIDMRWPKGGRSLYVRDPAGNSVELATPRIWELREPAGT